MATMYTPLKITFTLLCGFAGNSFAFHATHRGSTPHCGAFLFFLDLTNFSQLKFKFND